MTAPRSASRAATRVSGGGGAGARKAPIFVLARLSLGAALVAMLPGCLVDDPPAYTQPKRTPPRLENHRAEPLADRVIVARMPDVIEFRVPVASEDAGEGLRTQLWLDDDIIDYGTLPASTLDDTSREVLFNFSVVRSTVSGCHRFKIRVGHLSTLPQGSGPIQDPGDIAEAYWWANLNLPSSESGTSLKDCLTWEPPL